MDIENAIRHSLKAFGVRIKGTGRAGFEKRIRELTAEEPFTRELIGTMLDARAGLWTQFKKLDTQVVKITRQTELTRRFMEIPGVGPVTALSFMTGVDDPSRFKRSPMTEP